MPLLTELTRYRPRSNRSGRTINVAISTVNTRHTSSTLVSSQSRMLLLMITNQIVIRSGAFATTEEIITHGKARTTSDAVRSRLIAATVSAGCQNVQVVELT